MQSMGGQFYELYGPRQIPATAAQPEQCLICHGPGTIAPIAVMHRN
jgi:hypothetical protein